MQSWLAETLCKFISVRSISGTEQGAISFLEELYTDLGWEYELLPFEGDRCNIFVSFGTPKIIFTTHVDVVPAPDSLFEGRLNDGVIYGRGSNDAKGIAIAMIGAARELREKGCSDFGLLFVLEEETTGAGARKAAASLQGRGIEYLVNGEPTENKLAVAHKGGYGVYLSTQGKSCHSGYPEFGTDAIRLLLEVCHDLLQADFGSDEQLGKSTITIGTIKGGTASNVVPDSAGCDVLIRLVRDVSDARKKLQDIIGDRANIRELYTADPMRMNAVPGFEQTVVSYGTDVPHFSALGAKAYLYGPGTILRAHTDEEHILLSELEESVSGYCTLYSKLQ